MNKSILINCISVKRSAGGAFQVAKNFINSCLFNNRFNWIFLISEDLLLEFEGNEKFLMGNYFVFRTQPEVTTYMKALRLIRNIEKSLKPDLVYTIAAPSYFSFRAPEVMRYTNPWVADLNKYAFDTLNFGEKIKRHCYNFIQRMLIKKCKYFITQTDACKAGIIKITGYKNSVVKVIPNTLPSLYLKYADQIAQPFDLSNVKIINVLYITAPHIHKNIDLIPEVIEHLVNKFNIKNIRFNITVPINSPFLIRFYEKANSLGVKNYIVNHGYCNQDQLANLYLKSNIYFFPSLLETFSVSLLEALYFKQFIVATNFAFNKYITGEAALYFEPLNSLDAAAKISYLIQNKNSIDVKLVDELNTLLSNNNLFFNSSENFNSILDFLQLVLVNSENN